MILAAYGMLGTAITPALRVWLDRRARRGKEDPARLGERFGLNTLARPEGQLIWLHAASVGETQSVLTLVRALLAQHPALHLLITTGTLTSAALVAQQNLPRTIHQFVPVDTHAAVRRFLDHWRPDLALWVESELWPQLLLQARARRIPLLLLNARLSARSLKGWQRWPRLIRQMLGAFTAIYAGSTEDAARLAGLGARSVRDVGNLKFDAANLPVTAGELALLDAATSRRTLWIAASTHANEEQQIAEVHARLADQFPGLLTVLVPRHAPRGDAIAADLRARGFTIAQRSKGEPIGLETQLYLADTMGELGTFYRLAGIAFLGGSLVAHGGHNPLEPARLRCAILTGPHTHNFAAIVRRMREAEAIAVVHDKAELAEQVARLLRDDTERGAMAARAAQLVESARGASVIILQHCAELLELRP